MRDNDARLSAGVLKMKFMSKSRDNEERNAQAEQAEALFASQLPENLKGKKFYHEASYVPLEELRFGRVSYKNFNPSVEKAMQASKDEKEKGPNAHIKQEVSAKEMASFYSTMSKKFESTPQGSFANRAWSKATERGGHGGGGSSQRGQWTPRSSDSSRGGVERGGSSSSSYRGVAGSEHNQQRGRGSSWNNRGGEQRGGWTPRGSHQKRGGGWTPRGRGGGPGFDSNQQRGGRGHHGGGGGFRRPSDD